MKPEIGLKALSMLYELYAEQEGIKFTYEIEIGDLKVKRETGKRMEVCTGIRQTR